MKIQMNLPPAMEVGAHVDLASVWHTPNTFVIDFLAVKRPPQITVDEQTNRPQHGTLETTVAARVRIPPEQVFLLIDALRTQSNAWLSETGRSEPPEGWFPSEDKS